MRFGEPPMDFGGAPMGFGRLIHLPRVIGRFAAEVVNAFLEYRT